MSTTAQQWVRNRPWQDWAFAAVIVLAISYYAGAFGAFQHLPGPLFGGDIYYHYGHILHIYEFNNPMSSSHYAGEYEHYAWFSHLLGAIFARITGMEPLNAAIWFGPLIGLAGMLVMYLLGQRFLGNRALGLLLALSWLSIGRIPSPTPTAFATALLNPLLVLLVYTARSKRETLAAGVVYGIAGLSHTVSFLGGAIFIGIVAILRTLEARRNNEAWTRALTAQARWIGLMALVAVPIALLYWGPPALVYHGHTPNNWQEYTGRGLEGLTPAFLWQNFWDTLWASPAGEPTGILGAIFGILPHPVTLLNLLALIGFGVSVLLWRKNGLPLLVMLTGLLGLAHPWLTLPIIGTSFGYYRFGIFLYLARALFVILGIATLYKAAKNPGARWAVTLLSLLVLIAAASSAFQAYDQDRWAQAGRNIDGGTKAIIDLGNFARENLPADSVVLAAHGESAFAFNAASGMKVMHMRITHASPFVDANMRIADAAIILYGNDTQKRQELIREYGVTHIYADFYSAQSINNCLAAWDRFNDPSAADASYDCLRVSNTSLAPYLRRYGIDTKTVHARMDIASSLAPTYDLVIIKPTNVTLPARQVSPASIPAPVALYALTIG